MPGQREGFASVPLDKPPRICHRANMPIRDTHRDDPQVVALQALAWTLAEPQRAARLLSLTGLDADDLRSRLGEPEVLAAALSFLEAHQPDLLACAAHIGVAPERIVAAHGRLSA